MDAPTGLTSAEAARRLSELGEREPPSSRSVASIVVANVVTPFNAIIGVFFILILSLQLWADAIFGFIAMVNSAIGIRSELKAKRTLDELALLVAPRARVIRDGRDVELRAEEVVPGDIVRVEPGDQLIADGPVRSSRGLQMDESLLTGEADGIAKAPGDRMMSGSFCVSGSGTYELDAVREDSYAERLAGEAREFRHPPSPLQQEINRILLATVIVLVPLAALVLFSFNARSVPFVEAAQTATAGLVTLVPEGLVLLMSVTFALAAQRLARRETLVQQIAATEALASVDTICVDKTGTLTDGSLDLVAIVAPDGAPNGSAERALARFAASAGERNRTLGVIAERHPAPAEPVVAEVPFSSRWKWSGMTLGGPDPRTYVLGAPDVLAEAGALVLPGELAASLREHTHAGRRVVAFGRAERLPDDPASEPAPSLEPIALVVLSERLRPDALETVEFMRSQAVDLKLISGDARETVTAVAAAVGIPPGAGVIEGSRLPTERHELARAAENNTVFCRITPEQKKTLVAALSDRGRFTAMIGDGVNDVPALKSAKLAVAMGSGAQITKGIADIVLLSDAFSMLPRAVAEGRRIARNIHRLGRLYLTKSVYAGVLIALTAILGLTFPFLPRHLTVAALLTIGIPSFLLAILPSEGPLYRGRLLRSLSAFAFPAGIASAIASLASFWLVDGLFGGSIEEGRTAATTTLVVVGLAFILLLERGPGREHITIQSYMLALVMGLGALYAGILAIEPVRHFFELEILSGGQWFLALATAAGGLVLAALGWRLPFVERLEVPAEEERPASTVPEPTHRPASGGPRSAGNGSAATTERMAEGRSDP
ncbi:HAD-IC family P-type ATPase [Thermoleophilia bacterium SCSIO 60948]|nr:HAD-IC family P-type ATPase [Thermoleophilia bacterium SCSIO 60948]